VAKPDSATDLIFRRLSLQAPRHYRTWVRAGIIAAVVGYSVAFGAIVLEQPWASQGHPRELYVIAAGVLAAWLERRGRLRAAARLMLAAVWMDLHLSLLTLGLRAAVGGVFPAVVTGVTLFFGVRAGRLVACSSLLSVPAVVLVGPLIGLGPGIQSGDLLYLVAIVASTLAVAVPLSLLMTTLDGVLGNAERNARRVRELIDGAPDAILVLNQQGLIDDCNPSAEALFGRARGQLCSRAFSELRLSDPKRPEHKGSVALNTLGRQPREFLVDSARISPGGTPIRTPVEAIARTVTREDGARDWLVVLRDVTQRKLAEERTVSLQQQLQHAKKLEALGKLAGGVAHDFNNLLMAIGSYGDALARHPDPQVHAIAENLMGLKERAAGLTSHLVAFARKGMTQPHRMDLAQAVSSMPRLLRQLIGPCVTLEIDAPEPAFINADPAQIEQVLLNLALNARDAMSDGGILRISCRERRESGRVELCVSDTGHGMDETTRLQAFEPFFTTKPKSQGTGLGLALVQGIMEASGGKLELESTPGKGTRFTLSWMGME